MAGRHHQCGGIRWTDGAERSGIAGDAWKDLAVGRAHRERVNHSVRHAIVHDHFKCRRVRRPNYEVSVCIDRWNTAIR